MNPKSSRNILISLLAFLSLSAIGGGGVLIISPSGKLMGFPSSMLDHIPFTSFLFPGIILFFILGVSPLLVVISLIKKPESKLAEQFNLFKDMHWSWTFSIYIAFALIGWLQIQMAMLNEVSFLHTFYMFLAVAILLVALLPQVRNQYKKR